MKRKKKNENKSEMFNLQKMLFMPSQKELLNMLV